MTVPLQSRSGEDQILLRTERAVYRSGERIQMKVFSTKERGTAYVDIVKDGQTIVLGGLRDKQRDVNQSGIPILSRIPIIGGLFGSASRTSNETELYLFLTPRILKTDADADSVTAPRLPEGVER